MIAKYLLNIVAAVSLACVPVADGRETDTPTIRIEQSQLISSPASTSSSCIVVYKSRRFHFETRTQRFDEIKATTKVYEGVLTDIQQSQLQSSIDMPAIAQLPQFSWPLMNGATVTLRRGTTVKIWRDGKAQIAGYAAWHGGSASDSLEGASPEVRREQQDAEIALQPVMEWFYAVQRSHLQLSTAQLSQCNE